MTRFLAVMAVLLLSGCTSEAPPLADPPPGVILKGLEDPPRQCSRDTVERGQSYFMPDSRDIEQFEQALDAGLRSGKLYGGSPYFTIIGRNYGLGEDATLQRDWNRFYVGINRDGRRVLYGDFDVAIDRGSGQSFAGFWNTAMICDGGNGEFGAEMDLDSRDVRIVGFAGSVGG